MSEPNWCWRTHPRRGGVAVQLLAPVDASARINTSVLVQRTMDALDIASPAQTTWKLDRLVAEMSEEATRRLAHIRAPGVVIPFGRQP